MSEPQSQQHSDTPKDSSGVASSASKVVAEVQRPMHIYFSGIGGAGLGPLALIAKQAGYQVSGSDKQDSDYIQYLKQHGIDNIHIGQDEAAIAQVHKNTPIDWLVYSSAVAIENPDHPELKFCQASSIKTSKRDELLNQIISDKKLKLIAVAGTHGKTTTTAMLVWLFKQLDIPISYSLPAKISYGDTGEYNESSEYFIYEADEFDRNFLAFHPYLSLITGIDWDHPDIYPSRSDYETAFKEFVNQSQWVVFWQNDFTKLGLSKNDRYLVLNKQSAELDKIKLTGLVNRQDSWQVVQSLHELLQNPLDELITKMNAFPGLSRRFEQIVPGLFSDYAHTPAKIRGALQTGHELAQDNLVVIYEGLHNSRQHFIKDDLRHLFDGVKKLYVVPSYLAREDPNQPLLTPNDLIKLLSHNVNAQAAMLDSGLKNIINSHLQAGDTVLCLTAGGGKSLDEWLRLNFHRV